MVILFQTCQIRKNSIITTKQPEQGVSTVLQFTITTRSFLPRLRQVYSWAHSGNFPGGKGFIFFDKGEGGAPVEG